MTDLKISIITVAYNAEAYIEETIQSVLGQSYNNIEYIIIDGQSTDNTISICKKYEDQIHTIVSEPDKGLYDAMNKGIQLASGDIIGMLNADDFYENDAVIAKVANAFKNEKVDALYGDLVYVAPSNTSQIVRKWTSGEFQKQSFLKGWMPPHPTFFIRKKHYTQFGGYSLKLTSSADYELMLRMLYKEQLKPFYINEVLVRMRTGGVSNASLKNRLRANKEDKQAWEMNGFKPSALTFIRKPLSKITQFFKK